MGERAEDFNQKKSMKKIKNPNSIVQDLVKDYLAVYGTDLVSVILYGSAATHEYIPGKSDINIAIVLNETSMQQIQKSLPLHKKWSRVGVVAPFFMTLSYIRQSLDSWPIEFLSMRSACRVLYGEDVLSGLAIESGNLRLQCERELKGIVLHLRSSFLIAQGKDHLLWKILVRSLHELFGVFRALLTLQNVAVPNGKAGILSAIEDRYQLKSGVFSIIFNANRSKPRAGKYFSFFNEYVQNIESIIAAVDSDTGTNASLNPSKERKE